jgi:hypothetical protein
MGPLSAATTIYLESDFAKVEGYVFTNDKFRYIVVAADNGPMTPGLFYRFRIRARNSLTLGDYSNVLKVGLGPKPTKP